MRLPQDIANLLAVAIRDVLWFKDNVRSFLRGCGVDSGLLAEMPSDSATIKLVHHVLNRLGSLGKAGENPVKQMLTRMYYWKDIHTIPAERKDKALASLKELQKAYKQYLEQQRFQEEQERRMHDDRVERTTMKALDHQKLQAFRDEFDRIIAETNPQTRGNRYQDLMNKIFDYYAEESRGSFKRTGEQIDGLFYLTNTGGMSKFVGRKKRHRRPMSPSCATERGLLSAETRRPCSFRSTAIQVSV